VRSFLIYALIYALKIWCDLATLKKNLLFLVTIFVVFLT
jgi:hypothetical protein